ncbi:MAG: hypothetical protein ABJA70_14360, partial [Chryseolinea sp.]
HLHSISAYGHSVAAPTKILPALDDGDKRVARSLKHDLLCAAFSFFWSSDKALDGCDNNWF